MVLDDDIESGSEDIDDTIFFEKKILSENERTIRMKSRKPKAKLLRYTLFRNQRNCFS